MSKLQTSILAAAAVVMAAGPAEAQLTGSQRGWTYQIDARQAEGRNDRLGLDFDIRYSSQQEPVAPVLDSYGLAGRVKGFNTFDRDTRDVNSMVGELSLQGWRYRSAALNAGPLPAEQILEMEALLEKQDSDADLSPQEEARLNAFIDRVTRSRQYYTYAAHYRLETTQDVNVTQHAFGGTVGTEIPFLGGLLDILPASTRSGTRRAFPVRAILAVDYVKPRENAAEKGALLDTASWRGRAEMAWSSVVLDKYVLRASWEAHYLVDPPQAVRDADRRFNNFLQVWLKVPITTEAAVMLKYLSGRVPPTYENAAATALGFSVSFFP